MCKLVPALRVVGFVFLVLAILVCAVGFIAPFWIRIPVGDSLQLASVETPITGQVTDQEDGSPESPASAVGVAVNGAQQPNQESTDRPGQFTTATTTLSPAIGQATTTETSNAQDFVNQLSSLLNNGTYWGLWAMCNHNLSCKWFCENDFRMERDFPGESVLPCVHCMI